MRYYFTLFLLLITLVANPEQKFSENINMMGNTIINVEQSEEPSPTEVITFSFLQKYIQNVVEENLTANEYCFDNIKTLIYSITGSYMSADLTNSFINKQGDTMIGVLNMNGNKIINTKFDYVNIGSTILTNDAVNDVLNMVGSGRFYARDVICSNFVVLDTNVWCFKTPTVFSNVVNMSFCPVRGITNAIHWDMPVNLRQFTNAIETLKESIENATNSLNSALRDELEQAGQAIIDFTINHVDDRLELVQRAMLMFIDTNNVQQVGHKMTLLNYWFGPTNYIYSISPDGRYTNLISATVGE